MNTKPVAVNRRASFDYFITERFDAGIALTGTEVKSIREGRVSLNEAFVKNLSEGQVYVIGMHVSPYSHSQNPSSVDPARTRKLLLHKSEIVKLTGMIRQKGVTCIPLSIYFKNGRAKIQIGVGEAKKQHDKRESIKKKMDDRQIRQALKRKAG